MAGIFGNLNENQVLQILCYLAPADAISITQTSKNDMFAPKKALMEGYFEHCTRRIFGLNKLEGADGGTVRTAANGYPTVAAAATVTSWYEAFQSWHQALGEVSATCARTALHGSAGSLPSWSSRWIAAWRRIKTWLKRQPNARGIHESLRSEASDVSYLEKQGALKSVVDCWRLVDGQDLPLDPQVAPMVRSLPPLADGDEWSHGLFGGYQCYDHEICNVFLPLEAAKNITQHFAAMLKDRVPDMQETVLANKMVFGMSFNAAKVLFVDLKDGQVYIFTRKNRSILELAMPRGDGKDGFLRWFEEYARRLDTGYFGIDCLRPEEAPLQSGISLFPCAAPELSVCVTSGVEVKASAIYMPEHQAGWTYSIAMRLVGTKEERGFEMCQLVSRHWEIVEEGHEPERVDGDGVIGLFPILVEGGWLRNRDSDPHGQYAVHGKADGYFRYQSCLGRNAQMRTWFGGAMTFVPGTRRNPTGKPFRVKVEPFKLHVPEFLY